jgi:hypothetical protein
MSVSQFHFAGHEALPDYRPRRGRLEREGSGEGVPMFGRSPGAGEENGADSRRRLPNPRLSI